MHLLILQFAASKPAGPDPQFRRRSFRHAESASETPICLYNQVEQADIEAVQYTLPEALSCLTYNWGTDFPIRRLGV
jgi:hypothetical protein